MKASAWNSLKERKTVPAGPTTPCTGGVQITRLLGVVKSYSALRRYGFLNCADCEQDIWFSKADVVAGDLTIQVGLTVQFEMYRATSGTSGAEIRRQRQAESMVRTQGITTRRTSRNRQACSRLTR